MSPEEKPQESSNIVRACLIGLYKGEDGFGTIQGEVQIPRSAMEWTFPQLCQEFPRICPPSLSDDAKQCLSNLWIKGLSWTTWQSGVGDIQVVRPLRKMEMLVALRRNLNSAELAALVPVSQRFRELVAEFQGMERIRTGFQPAQAISVLPPD